MPIEWTQVVIALIGWLKDVKLPASKPPEMPSMVEIYKKSLEEAHRTLAPKQPRPTREFAGEEAIPRDFRVVSEQMVPVSDVSTACMSCSRAHLTGSAGGLGEALRFARDEGMTSPEVVSRINRAEEEIVQMERIDLSPAKIAASPLGEQAIAKGFLPRIRILRQRISNIQTLEDLEWSAAESQRLADEIRAALLELKQPKVQKLIALAEDVRDKKLTLQEAKKKVLQLQ